MTLRARRLCRRLLWCAALAAQAGCSDAPRYQIDPSVVERPLPGPDTPLDSVLVQTGSEIFRDRCLACHKLGPGVAVGPDLSGVTLRREPAWIRAMVMNPDSMLRTDSVARALLYQYQVPM